VRHGPFGTIDLVDHAEQELSHDELAGSKPRQAGGASSRG